MAKEEKNRKGKAETREQGTTAGRKRKRRQGKGVNLWSLMDSILRPSTKLRPLIRQVNEKWPVFLGQGTWNGPRVRYRGK